MSELKQILGNRHNIEHFKEAVRKGKVSHAYIIDGPEGIGKKTFAGYIAAALLCEKGIEEGQKDASGPEWQKSSEGTSIV